MTRAARPLPVASEAYSAYGLAILSEVVLPELERGNPAAAPDLVILRAPVPAGLPAGGASFAGGRATFGWDAVGAFMVEPGRITVDPAPGVADDVVAFPLLGPVLAVALSMAGHFVLHASAVEVAGRSIVLMGDKGAGKSTTAAALLAAGHRLIADDLVALRFHGDRVSVVPGFPQVKLGAPALGILPAAAGDVRPPAHPAIGKTRVRLSGAFAREPVPLGRLYLLDRGGDGAVLPSMDEAALPVVLRHAYLARFGRAALAGDAGARHFRHAVAAAGTGRVALLRVPEGLGRTGEIAGLVLRDLRRAP